MSLSVSHLRNRTRGITTAIAADDVDGDRLALWGDRLIVEIEEVTRAALEEVGGLPQGKLVVADGESAGGKGVFLAWSGVELELMVGNDRSNATLSILENTVIQGGHKASSGAALRRV